MDSHPIPSGKVEGNVRVVHIIIGKILLDDIPLVAAADHKVMKAEAGIDFHNMPQNGLLANADHGLRLQMALLADASAQAASQNHYFHRNALLT
jgi:hypothetical protein